MSGRGCATCGANCDQGAELNSCRCPSASQNWLELPNRSDADPMTPMTPMTPMPYGLRDISIPGAKISAEAVPLFDERMVRVIVVQSPDNRPQSGMQEWLLGADRLHRRAWSRSSAARPEGYYEHFETGFWYGRAARRGPAITSATPPCLRSPTAGLCSLPMTPGHNVADLFIGTTEHAGPNPRQEPRPKPVAVG